VGAINERDEGIGSIHRRESCKKLEEISRRREKIPPHYRRYTKRVFLIGPVVIIIEALYWNLIAGWRGILFTPMIVVAFLPATVIEGMNEFAEQFTFPVTFALSPGKFYYFIEYGSFFNLDKAEVNTGTSFSTILHRHLQDLQLAVDSFAVLKLQELAPGTDRKRGGHPEVG